MLETLDRVAAGLGAIGGLRDVRIDPDVVTAQFGHAQGVRALGPPIRRNHRRHTGSLNRRQIPATELGMLGQCLALLRPAERDRGPVLLDQFERLGGVERRLGDECRPVVDHREQAGDEPAHPEERHGREHHGIRRDTVVEGEIVGVADQRSLAVHRCLRVACAARGVDDHRVVGRSHAGFDGGQELRVDSRRPLVADRGAPWTIAFSPHRNAAQVWCRLHGELSRIALLGQSGQRLFEQSDEVLVAERRPRQDDPEVGMSRCPRELGSLVEGVQRDRDSADSGGGEPGDRPLDAVRHQDPDMVSLAHARSKQNGCQPGRAQLQFGVAEFIPCRDQERPIAEALCARPRQSRDGRGDGGKRHGS